MSNIRRQSRVLTDITVTATLILKATAQALSVAAGATEVLLRIGPQSSTSGRKGFVSSAMAAGCRIHAFALSR